MSKIDASQITEYLYIAAHPKAKHKEQALARGVRMLICMIFHPPALVYWKKPFHLVWLPSFDYPHLPIPINFLQKGVREALPVINRGESVMVYCREGRHRSVAMACCILIGLGHSSSEAMELVKEKREVADPDVYYIRDRITEFEDQWVLE